MGAAAAPIVGLQGAGMVLGAYGNYESGQANSAIDRMNAAYARTQAAQTLEAGEFKAGVTDVKETALAGAQASSFAAQGVVAGAGSAASVVEASDAMSQADKGMIRLNASRQAYGFETQAANDDFQARMARRMGDLGAVSSVVQGAGQMAFTSAMLGNSAGGGPGPNGTGPGGGMPGNQSIGAWST